MKVVFNRFSDDKIDISFKGLTQEQASALCWGFNYHRDSREAVDLVETLKSAIQEQWSYAKLNQELMDCCQEDNR